LKRDANEDLLSKGSCGRGSPTGTAPSGSSQTVGSRSSGELIARDKANLDITWLRDKSLEDADNLPAPEVLARGSSRT
jgi:hypothetical protein